MPNATKHLEEHTHTHTHTFDEYLRLNSFWFSSLCQKIILGATLVVQWLRICLQRRGHGFDPWSRD